MRNRSLALLILALGTSAFGAEPAHERRDRRSLDRVVCILKALFGVTSTSDELTPPRPEDPGSKP